MQELVVIDQQVVHHLVVVAELAVHQLLVGQLDRLVEQLELEVYQ